MRAPRLLVAAPALLLLAVLGILFAWAAIGSPPPRLLSRYGLPPKGGLTGRRLAFEGVDFVELSPGYCRAGSHYLCDPGDLLGRICALVGIDHGRPPRHDGSECPTFWAEIPVPLYLARTEVTNGQYARFDPERKWSSFAAGENAPAAEVPLADAVRYCEWLARRSGRPVRLPSGDEWEYACRAGSTGEFCFGADPRVLQFYGWYDANSGGHAHEVATRMPNAWGLFDMHGNVAEWDSAGSARGGEASRSARDCRSAGSSIPIRQGARRPVSRGAVPGVTGFRPAFSGVSPQAARAPVR